MATVTAGQCSQTLDHLTRAEKAEAERDEAMSKLGIPIRSVMKERDAMAAKCIEYQYAIERTEAERDRARDTIDQAIAALDEFEHIAALLLLRGEVESR